MSEAELCAFGRMRCNVDMMRWLSLVVPVRREDNAWTWCPVIGVLLRIFKVTKLSSKKGKQPCLSKICKANL